MSNASLSFLPWVRQGAASAITVPDNTDNTPGPKPSGVASVAAPLTLNGDAPILNGTPVPAVSILLRGPADVVGIDANQIVRTDPRSAAIDFEPNCFPSIEFDRADFPWLFTPAKANANTQLRPWLCLVVVQKQAGVSLASTSDAPLPSLQIAPPAKPAVELPDLKDSWAWAHAQVAADDSSEQLVRSALNGAPERSLSRLVCPRILAPDTDYIACVVPTFELGRKAGLGLPVPATDLSALAPAWSLAPTAPVPVPAPVPAPVLLPVYYHWEFRTGQKGDFESLASDLTATVPEGLGKRTIDISRPGFPASGATTVELEGALLPILPANGPPPPPALDPIPLEFKTTLASIINEPSRNRAADPNADPLLAPPTYGRWHAGKAAVSPTGTTWLDQLNLDPRWRVAAAFGTRVIQEHQEALMASAWEQAAELPTANQRLRQFQLSMAVGECLHQRHFSGLSEEAMLRIAAPAFGRLRQSTERSLLAYQARSPLPVAANRSAMRRIGRQRGPLTRRVAAQGAAQGFRRSDTNTWVAILNNMGNAALAPPPPPALEFSVMPSLPFQHLAHDSYYGAFLVAPENAPMAAAGEPFLVENKTEIPDLFRTAAIEHLDRFFPSRAFPPRPHFIVFENVKQQVLEQTEPRVALPALVNAVISTGDNVLAPTAPDVTPVGVETVMAAPSFPQPMYEALRDLSQELLLPGLDKVKPDTVLGLKTNRRFVEAYMVGLNHEMGRELLWRGYPTDQRGTYFDHFWGVGVPNSAPKDITDLNTWSITDPETGRIRTLGDSVGAPPLAEEFVMLLRSRLLKRYPNAVIYLTPAILKAGGVPSDPNAWVPDETQANEKSPIFSGSMQPDVCFFGFPVTTRAAIGGPGIGLGYYVVIQEHPTEPRFGLDVGISLGNASHLVVGATPPAGLPLNGRIWDKNAAEMAGITRRLPVRIAIHASRLVTST